MEDVTNGVKAIEVEAEKMLEEARNNANEILVKAKEEARKILSSELSVGEVEAECKDILGKARDEADKKIEDSKRHATEIRTKAAKRVDEIVASIVAIVTGAES